MFKNLLLAGAAVLILGSAAPAQTQPAQTQPVQTQPAQPQSARPMAGDPTASPPARRESAQSMAGRIEQRITDLHRKLQITREQQPLWQAFITVMRENARGMDETFQRRVRGMPEMTAVQNMQSYAQVSAAHAADMQRMVPSFEALYATMSEAQRAIADRVFRDDARRDTGKRG